MNRIYPYTCLRGIFVFAVILYLGFTAPGFGEPLKESPVLDGVYAWFPLDGDTKNVGPHLNGAEIIGPKPAPDRTGKSSGAMHFNGISDFIKMELNINPSTMPRMSVAMWIKPEKEKGVIFSHDDGGWDRSVSLEDRPESRGLTVFAGNTAKWVGSPKIALNKWQLVIAVWDGPAGTASVYKKSHVLEKAVSRTASPGKGRDYTLLGKIPYSISSNAGYFKGDIDNVVVWNRALSEKEIADIFNNPEMLDSAPRMEIMNSIDSAKELLNAGFYEEGVNKFSEALDKAGFKIRSLLPSDTVFDDNRDVPARYLGEIFLSQYRTLMSLKKIAKPGFFMEDKNGEIRVSYMFKDVPASEAGVRLDDIVTEADRRSFGNRKEIEAYFKSKTPGDTVKIKINRAGSVKEFSFKLVSGMNEGAVTAYAVYRMMDYGMLAAYAGHSSLVMQAVMEIKRIVQKYPGDMMSYFTDEVVALLESLAIAMEQGAGPAYSRLLKFGKLSIYRSSVTENRDYFYPLYKDPKKLAYFLGKKDASSLKLPENMNPPKQAYINLKGEVVEPDGNIPELISPGKDETITEKSTVKGTVLD